MPFKKNHQLGFIALETQPLDPKPLTIKVRAGIRSQVMSIPDWQPQMRDVIEAWLKSKLDQIDEV